MALAKKDLPGPGAVLPLAGMQGEVPKGESAPLVKKDGMEGSNIFFCKTNEEAITLLEQKLQSEDVVLLKASNSLNFTQICEAIL